MPSDSHLCSVLWEFKNDTLISLACQLQNKNLEKGRKERRKRKKKTSSCLLPTLRKPHRIHLKSLGKNPSQKSGTTAPLIIRISPPIKRSSILHFLPHSTHSCTVLGVRLALIPQHHRAGPTVLRGELVSLCEDCLW